MKERLVDLLQQKVAACWSGTDMHVEQQAMKDSFTQGQGNPSASHSELEKAPGLYLRATQFEASSRKTSILLTSIASPLPLGWPTSSPAADMREGRVVMLAGLKAAHSLSPSFTGGSFYLSSRLHVRSSHSGAAHPHMTRLLSREATA